MSREGVVGLARQGIAYVPYFPLGGFTPLQSSTLSAVADPELFAAYRTLAADAKSVVAAHIEELVELAATVIRLGVKEGTFRGVALADGRAERSEEAD